MSVLSSAVEKFAPMVASALGGPGAGIATAMLENLFGVKSIALADAITQDPSAETKLKELELQHGEALANISATNYSSEITDRLDARKMNEVNHDWIVHFLAIMYTVGFFVYTSTSLFDNNHFDKGVFHDLLNVLMLVCSFYFGSSFKSKN